MMIALFAEELDIIRKKIALVAEKLTEMTYKIPQDITVLGYYCILKNTR